MKLSTAKTLHDRHQTVPALALKCNQPEGEGEFDLGNWTMVFDGDAYNHYYISRNYRSEGYTVSHCVYGGSYGSGDTPKAAMLDFINRNPKIKAEVTRIKKFRAQIARAVAA